MLALLYFFSFFSPSRSTRFLAGSSPVSPLPSPQGGAVGSLKESAVTKGKDLKAKVSPKKSFLNKDGRSRQTLDKNIKQLFGARMTSKGKILFTIFDLNKTFGYLQKVAKKGIYFTLYVCTERIVDRRPFMYNSQNHFSPRKPIFTPHID